ncbi:hypothetical protein Pan153_44140 [Gimesia panareensis]|uniref:Uncharacterized protein n=1 Tax=Gimesia panareensis TaxID=2527978 RepID=A0A518FTS3_9PLAN|nr:hypothetical protein [Gimesia panareensis]QDV19746.1 hypothetical protein Pan153_44140 [Gimesia panareensis]
MKQSTRTSWHFNLISAVLAFLLWGGWAFVMNSGESVNRGLVAGLTQGTASFLITLCMVHAVTYLFHRFEKPLVKVVLPACIVICFTGFCLVNVHTLMGTPRILVTILPALMVAFSFCMFTSWRLLRIHQQQGATQYE